MPLAGTLVETIQCFVETADDVLCAGLCGLGQLDVDLLLDGGIQEGCLDVEAVDVVSLSSAGAENRSQSYKAHGWGKDFVVVDALALAMASDDQSCLVSHWLVIGVVLEFEDKASREDFVGRGHLVARDRSPRVVVVEGLDLALDGCSPLH